MSIEVPEVMEAADKFEALLHSPPIKHDPTWDSIAHRLDDTMRNRLLEWAKEVR